MHAQASLHDMVAAGQPVVITRHGKVIAQEVPRPAERDLLPSSKLCGTPCPIEPPAAWRRCAPCVLLSALPSEAHSNAAAAFLAQAPAPLAISPSSATELHSALGLKVRIRALSPSQAVRCCRVECTLAPGCLDLLPRWLPRKSPAPAASIDTRSRKSTAPPSTSVAQPTMPRSRRKRRVMGRKLPSLSHALALYAAGRLFAGSTAAATVISVGEGDTLRAADHGKSITIQMAFRDAPKMAQAPYGQQMGERSPEISPQALEWIKQANAFESQGAHGKAAELWEQVLILSEKTQGPEHPNTANSLRNLAGLYYNLGAYTKAEPLLKRAPAIREKARGPDHLDTALSLINLAMLYYNHDTYAKAEALHLRALAITEKALGPDHPDTGESLFNLAGPSYLQGAYTKAEPLYLRALAIYEKAHGPDHPDTALARDLLEQCRKSLSKPDSGD